MFHTRISPPREHVPPGLRVGRFFAIIDLGTQSTTWQGKTRLSPQLNISVEFPDHKVKSGDLQGKPLVITRRFANSMSDRANLRKFLAQYLPTVPGMKPLTTDAEIKEFMENRFWKLIGRAAKFTVTHKPKKENPEDIFSTFEAANHEEGMICPPATNKPLLFIMGALPLWDPSPANAATLQEPMSSIYKKYGKMKDVFHSLSDKQQETIAASPEYKAISQGRTLEGVQPDAPEAEEGEEPF